MVKRRMLKVSKRQTGKSVTKLDKKKNALAPGKRVSVSGKVYYESRRNRSDKSKKTKL